MAPSLPGGSLLISALWLLIAQAATCPPGDSDLDSIPNTYEDIDGNNDCDDDDSDGDGTPDYLDTDDDDDGIDTLLEGLGDAECLSGSDGIPNYLDEDSDGDGISDFDEGTGDDDGDFIPNWLDCTANGVSGDPDLDGLTTLDENSLLLDPLNPDTDDDGILDSVEVVDVTAPVDTDGNGFIDALDDDDDGDGFSTREETGWECANGQPWTLQFDNNTYDWQPTCSNGSPILIPPRDTDGDTVADYLDADDDGDGTPSGLEGDGDIDADGLLDWLDADDNDGPTGDIDEDGILNQDDEDNDTPPVTDAGTTTTTTPETEPPDTQTTPGGADIEIVDIEGSNGTDRCGCSTSSGPAALWVLSLFPLLLRRRRN